MTTTIIRRPPRRITREGLTINADIKNLLDDLHLDDTLRVAPPRRRGLWLAGAGAALLLGLGAALAAHQAAEPATASFRPAAHSTAVSSTATPSTAAAPETARPAGGTPGDPAVSVNASGYVLAERSATVSSDTTGRLNEILVKEGETVAKGQLLATIDQRVAEAQLALTKAQLETARSAHHQTVLRLDEGRQKLRRFEQLRARQFVSEEQLDSAQYAVSFLEAELATNASDIKVALQRLTIQEQQLDSARIYAPFSGVVTELAAQVGEIVSPISAGGGFTRTGICTIIDIDSLKVEVQVSERHIEKIHLGQEVSVHSIAYPNEKMRGSVSYIMPQANRETASIAVKIDLLEKSRNVIPNMRVDVVFLQSSTPGSDDALAASR